eukprot:877993-Rhodomonas_salina.1
MLKLGRGESIRLGKGVLAGIEEQVPDRVIEGELRKLVVTMECCLRTDNDKGTNEERAEEKEEKDHSARALLLSGLWTVQGLDWNVKHVLFITGWKTSMDKSKWEENLMLLGIALPKHKGILQRAADAALCSFGSRTDAVRFSSVCGGRREEVWVGHSLRDRRTVEANKLFLTTKDLLCWGPQSADCTHRPRPSSASPQADTAPQRRGGVGSAYARGRGPGEPSAPNERGALL